MKPKMNQQQQHAFAYIMDEVDDGMYVVNSPAGTGKTFLAEALRDASYYPVEILAPTNKACQLYSPVAKTICSFFRGQKDVDEDGNEFWEYTPNTQCKDQMIIVDECSMVDDRMFELFEQLSRNNIILFLGDYRQLPPIQKRDQSDQTVNSKTFDCQKVCDLTENMRARDSITRYLIEEIGACVDTLEPPRKTLLTKPVEEYFECFERNPDADAVLLAYTNVKVNYYNNAVRRRLYCDNEPNAIPLVIYDNETIILKEPRNSYATNESVCIRDTKAITETIPFYKCSHRKRGRKCDCPLPNKRQDGLEINFIRGTCDRGFEWRFPKEEADKKKVFQLIYHFRDYCKKMRNKSLWKEFYAFKASLLPEYCYRYAMTIHRAQGSGWMDVYVDLDNILFVKDIELRYRLLYTAASRTRQNLTFIR